MLHLPGHMLHSQLTLWPGLQPSNPPNEVCKLLQCGLVVAACWDGMAKLYSYLHTKPPFLKLVLQVSLRRIVWLLTLAPEVLPNVSPTCNNPQSKLEVWGGEYHMHGIAQPRHREAHGNAA